MILPFFVFSVLFSDTVKRFLGDKVIGVKQVEWYWETDRQTSEVSEKKWPGVTLPTTVDTQIGFQVLF